MALCIPGTMRRLAESSSGPLCLERSGAAVCLKGMLAGRRHLVEMDCCMHVCLGDLYTKAP
jgi:hypothetical protein